MLTHSTTDKVHYGLFWNGKLVAEAVRATGGFVLTEGEGEPAPMSMAALKARLTQKIQAERRAAEPKQEPNSFREPDDFLPSRQDWTKRHALSHTGEFVYLREAKRTWPELKGPALYAYLIRKGYEARRQWQGYDGELAQRWLDANPEFGAYDASTERERLLNLYPELAA